MTEKRGFWIALEVGTILLFILIIGGAYLVHQPAPGWILIGLLMLLHLSEMPMALRIGKEMGVHPSRIIIMNMLFGFTWWVPVRKGIFK